MSKKLIDVEDLNRLRINPKRRNFAKVSSTVKTQNDIPLFKKNSKEHDFKGNFLESKESHIEEEHEALSEALRCLKCADAPCEKSCPTKIDIAKFIYSISKRNYYGAAKVILSDNPNGLSCGNVCPTSSLCVGGCNLKNPININGLQAFALRMFQKMGLKQIRDPSIDWENVIKENPVLSKKIALIGSGPSSISCATFLSRMGYENVTIFEKEKYPGGLSISEIPQNRLHFKDVMWEIELMKDLGVKIEYGKELGKDISIAKLKEMGFESVFVGIGQPEPKLVKEFDGLNNEMGFYTSKSFLPKVATAVKPCCGESTELPKLSGHCIILGAGDTAMDCASTALRCGAEKVTVILRRGFNKIRAVDEERDAIIKEGVNFLPNFSLKKVNCKNGKINSIECFRTVEEGEKVKILEGQSINIDCQFVISAFGSTLKNEELKKSCDPLKFEPWGMIKVNEEMQTNVEWIFAGGDIVGSKMTVEATNDGKVAAWGIHKYLHTKNKKGEKLGKKKLPRFFTEIDKIDIGVELCGVKFENPFGFASAPPSTTVAMIARGFEQGWAFAVTKTFSLDFDNVTNVAPRIVKGTTSGLNFGPNQGSYLNIELISEKSCEYWLEGIKQLKKKYPKKVVVASIMAGFVKEHWEKLAREVEKAGADIIELNLSCPHGMGEKGMGLAVGQDSKFVEEICRWVKGSTKLPVFAKMTPNITDIRLIAGAAKKGGADGVQCINTVSGLMGLNAHGVGWPNIEGKTTYGGVSGNMERPIMLKFLSTVHNKLDKYPCMASGGIESAETALQAIRCGASVCQVSSAVHNENYSIIDDWIDGLRALMWITSNPDMKEWDGNSPDKSLRIPKKIDDGFELGKMGKELEKRREKIVEKIKSVGYVVSSVNDVEKKDGKFKIPSVNELIGSACKDIVNLFALDPKYEKHVIAKIFPDICIGCGRCYQTCCDTGYQAIDFNEETHVPEVNEKDCTGCGLCLAVCPVIGAIEMVKRNYDDNPYKAKRGIPFGNFGLDSLKK